MMATFSTGIKGQQPLSAISSKFLACDPFPSKVMVRGRGPGMLQKVPEATQAPPRSILYALHTVAPKVFPAPLWGGRSVVLATS